jgi:restriction system protein
MKRTDPFIALFALLCRLPWGVHAFLAVASAFAAAFLIPAYLDLASFTPVATLAAWMACIGFTTAAIGTAHLSRRRGELFRGHCHLGDIKALKWRDFKNLIAVLYRKRGFKVDQCGGAKPGGGIDLIARKNGRVALVQCHHSRERRIGIEAVRELLGVVVAERAHIGYLVTPEGFTDDAHALAQTTNRLRLITGCDLLRVVKSLETQTMPSPAPGQAPYPAPSTPAS